MVSPTPDPAARRARIWIMTIAGLFSLLNLAALAYLFWVR